MKIIAFDLGTGGIKASLYNEKLQALAQTFLEYQTIYPAPGFHEQRPDDWWEGVCRCCRDLLEISHTDNREIGCLALSGHSLVTVPVKKNRGCLTDSVPIWSDTRAEAEAEEFFKKIPQKQWYETTGNGFPPACYSIFKLMWMKNHQREIYASADGFLGSKDYINWKLTGQMATDFSYASGCGAYHLDKGELNPTFLEAAGLSPDKFPPILPSHQIVGTVTKEAARCTGLIPGTPVACGGVDNACMALGAVGNREGAVYISLGTSSWIPVNSSRPVLDAEKKPYVFAHIQEGMYTSAFSIFSGGNSFRWIRDMLSSETGKTLSYDELCHLAKKSPPGAGGVLFNPSLAGGTSQDKSTNIRGAFLNLSLSTGRNDLIRAALEGITMNLKCSYDFMKEKTRIGDTLMICGGGSKSPFWMQLFADIFQTRIVKTNIDQDAASLGAAAIAARAVGLYDDYSVLQSVHQEQQYYMPNTDLAAFYKELTERFRHISYILSDLGDYMQSPIS